MSEILDPIRFPLRGARLIEASAGTGKTYTLAALYVRLVLGHGDSPEPLLPPDILVVTFTEAATRELRDRIRARLAEAALCFACRAQPEGHDLFLQTLLQEYPQDEHPLCAARLDAAAQWMDEAAIYTIHGFCNRMLRQHAFDSGSLFTLELNQDEQSLREQAAADYWRSFFYNLNDEATGNLLDLWPTPTALMQAVRPMLGHQHQFAEELRAPAEIIAEISAARQAILDDLRQRWGSWTSDLLEKFEAAWDSKRLPKSKPTNSATIRKWFEAIVSWLENPDQPAPKLTDTFFLRMNAQSLADASDRIPEIVSDPAIAAIDELDNIEARLPALLPALLPHAARWISQRMDQYKRRHGMIGYDDMLTRLRDAMTSEQGPRLAAIIRQQFPVAMIDEFQDTDPVQYQVFSTLYADQPGTTWLMIGDPKQAIYGFRGADIHTYLAARRATEGRHYTLDKNFRSSEALVQAANHLFSYAGRYPDGSFLYRDIPFSPVKANSRLEHFLIDGQPATAMTLWQLDSGMDDPSLSKGQYLKEMAARTASEIVRLLNLEQRCGFEKDGKLTPLRPADIAILVRDGKEAGRMRSALGERGLRSVYLSDKDSVFDSVEATDLLCWLQAVAEPESEQKIRAALATATLALSWQELDELSRDEQLWEVKVEQFHLYHRQWQQQGVLPMIRALLRDYQVPARLLGNDDERGLTNLLHLAELAQRAASQLDGELALVRWLAESIDNSSDAGEDTILRLESDADLIRIVTIHKSKGLEYPLVFLPFICTFRAEQGKYLPLRFHDENNIQRLTLTPTQQDIDRADRERLGEDLRLLYVAVTRARHACWLGMAPLRIGQGKDRTDLPGSAIGYVLTGGAAMQPSELAEKLDALAQHCDAIQRTSAPDSNDIRVRLNADRKTLPPARDYHGPEAEHWWIASYSALEPEARAANEAPRDVRDEVMAEEKQHTELTPSRTADNHADTDSIHHFARGPQAGTFLHGLLELAGTQGFAATLQQRREEFRQQLQRRSRVAGWETQHAMLERWFEDYLNTALPFGNQSLRLADLPRQQCQPEMEFWIQSSAVSTEALDQLVQRHVLPGQPRPALRRDTLNGMLKGFIDLVLVDQGRYFVADYKSNWLGPDEQSYSNRAMADVVLEKRYDVQMCLYLLALHRLLRARLGEGYQPSQHLGGAALLFLRGLYSDSRGVCFQPPIMALVESLDALFRGRNVMENANVL